ncbi:MAG: hypothetical protein IMZ59_04445 [Actinobacteria bacterium]|nr:hypothetical protein [Actinomycetota bacterium]
MGTNGLIQVMMDGVKMRVIKKVSESYYYAPEKFCCKKFKKEFGQSLHIDSNSHKIYFVNDNSHEYKEIYFCPFCGEKIEYIDEIEWSLIKGK